LEHEDSSARPYGTSRKQNLFKTAHGTILLCLDFLAASRAGRRLAPANCAVGISTSSIIAQCSITRSPWSRCPNRVSRVIRTMGRSLPVYPNQQTFSEAVGMSQRCQQQNSCTAAIAASFSYLSRRLLKLRSHTLALRPKHKVHGVLKGRSIGAHRGSPHVVGYA
jgi:hypothetical protein